MPRLDLIELLPVQYYAERMHIMNDTYYKTLQDMSTLCLNTMKSQFRRCEDSLYRSLHVIISMKKKESNADGNYTG